MINRIPTRLTEVDTLLTADSVEWCPTDTPIQVLAVGTYQLDETSGVRHGSLSLYSYSPTCSTTCTSSVLTDLLQDKTIDLHNGILDMKWHKDQGKTYLALANSDGSISFLDVGLTTDSTNVSVLERAVVAGKDGEKGICLSLDWSKTSSTRVIGVSDSLGQISLVELCESSPRLLRQWKAHGYESWIVALDHNPSVVYSGGDDCRLCVWDTRLDCGRPSLVSKRHSMGVCSLQVHPTESHLLASGSYDESLLLWDTRSMAKPLKDTQLGGGVWRVKWNNTHPDLLATACMHNGFQLVHSHLQTSQAPEVICQYSEHSSLAYGIDWCPYYQPLTLDNVTSADDMTCKEGVVPVTLASCSFYDHSMHIWTADVTV